MSPTEHQREVLIAKRTRALATMLLASRKDLLIEEVNEDIGLDYLVRFRTKGKAGLRAFGVVLRGAWAAVTREEANTALLPAMHLTKSYGPFLRPVCLFFFTMEDDGAWYSWVAEPIAPEDAKPLLRFRDEPDCRRLDKGALKEIIERVDSWHDTAFPSLP